jgi:hypothetical protein
MNTSPHGIVHGEERAVFNRDFTKASNAASTGSAVSLSRHAF